MGNQSLLALENYIEWNSLIATGDLSSIQSKLDHGKLSRKDRLGEYELSPLHLAAWHNQPEICEFLITQKISPNVTETFSEKNPLHIAAYFGQLEVAEILISHGIKLTSRKSVDMLGCHPLHYAALGESEKMITQLLGYGHLMRTVYPFTSFNASTLSALGNTLDILIRKRNFSLCDFVSSAEGISIVETNPRVGSAMYIGYSNENPWTPFHSAAVLGERKIVEMLLRKFPYTDCFNQEFADVFDYTPGEVALVEGHTEVAKLLGESRTVLSGRQAFNHIAPIKNAPSYSKDLLKAISERDFSLLDKLIAEHGNEMLYQPSFNEPHRSSYMEHDDLNAFSVVARLFCVTFAEWLKTRNIQIVPKEFLGRDQKERMFFNWSMVDINPYAGGFFKKVSEEIHSFQPK